MTEWVINVPVAVKPSPSTPPEWSGKTAHYVRAGATGSADGSDWTNAYTDLPDPLTRDHVYYVADGTYSGYTFNDAVSGTLKIYVVKATASDHGTDTGWSSAYGDGQAIWNGGINFNTSYFEFNGQSRNENDWQESASYGFKVSQNNEISLVSQISNITVKYTEVEGTAGDGSVAGIRMTSQEGPLWRSDLVFSRMHFKNNGIAIFSRESDDVTIDYCWIGPGWSKEAISHQYGANWIIANNYFVDCASGSGADQLTAVIGMFNFAGGGSQTPADTQVENGQLYGCVFAKSSGAGTQAVSDGVVSIISTGWVFYNNTIASIFDSGPIDIRVHKNGEAGDNNTVRNTLLYDASGAAATTETEGDFWIDTATHSLTGTVTEGSENPFVATDNWRLKTTFSGNSPKDIGVDLGAPYNVDIDGNTRGAGSGWDIGAFEFIA